MSDYSEYTVVAVVISASDAETIRISNAGFDSEIDGDTYLNSDGLYFGLSKITGAMEGDDCKIGGIKVQGTFLASLSNNAPFSKVSVEIVEYELDMDTDAVLNTRYLFNGLVYQVQSDPISGYMDLTCKDWKYYTDLTAGVACTEDCAWKYFGDKGCGKTVHAEEHVINSVSGLFVDIVGPLADTTPLLFNKGYIELNGVRIKIKYHSSGNTFQLSKAAPSSWLGETVTIYAGCDRTLSTCKSIHNNEANFLGLGYAMVDYDPTITGS